MSSKSALEWRNLPQRPGVYLFKDKDGQVLYVGKAGSLKKRVSSYFSSPSRLTFKQQVMLEKAEQLDFYVTDSEVEALLLENNLIKEHRPPYNVMLRDDKSYPYLAVTLGDEYPRVTVTRRLHIDGAKYFGPFTKAKALRQTLDVLRRLFPLRTCRRKEPGRSSGSPCLYFEIGKCLAPCTGRVSPETYRAVVKELCDFLEGGADKVLLKLEKEMKDAANNLNFEKAALLRDKLTVAKQVVQRQKMVTLSRADFDLVGFYQEDELIYFKVFLVRKGRLVGSRGVILEGVEDGFLEEFLKRFYVENPVPPAIYLPKPVTEEELIKSFLEKKRGGKVRLVVPRSGQRRELLEMTQRNAVYAYRTYKLRGKAPAQIASEVIEQLQQRLGLSKLPYRIECFDVSNLRGAKAVASMVVFEDARPKKRDYRRFRIKEVLTQDDFQMMKEAVSRRLKRLQEGEDKWGQKPDLIVVDGGKPQLKAALEALEETGLAGEIPVVALAKREEELYLPNRREPVRWPLASLSLRLLQHLRDESHRFALAYHRKLRDKEFSRSYLEEVPGVGRRRAQLLLNTFGSAKGVGEASLKDLKKVLPSSVAVKVYDFFRS